MGQGPVGVRIASVTVIAPRAPSPCLLNLAGPAVRALAGGLRIAPRVGLPRCAALFLMRAASTRETSPRFVAGGVDAEPGFRSAHPFGWAREPRRRRAASLVALQRPNANVETFEPGDTTTLQSRRTLGARAAPRRETRTSDPRCHPPSDRAACVSRRGEPQCALGCEVPTPKRAVGATVLYMDDPGADLRERRSITCVMATPSLGIPFQPSRAADRRVGSVPEARTGKGVCPSVVRSLPGWPAIARSTITFSVSTS